MLKVKLILTTIFCAILSLQLVSCGGDDEGGIATTEITGVTLDQSTLSLEEEETVTLVSTLAPVGATGAIVWSSSDTSVATVNEGEVTGVSEGTSNIVASIGAFTATCEVTVTKKVVTLDHETLNGSDYYIVQMGEQSYNAISDKVIHDLRPSDDGVRNLFVWDNTLNGGNAVGTNFYGLDEGWVNFNVGTVGWSGAGYSVGSDSELIDMTRMFDNPEDYYLHIGLKTGQASSSYLFILSDGTSQARIAIGDDFNDNGTTFTSYQQLVRDNNWNSIEIPITYLNSLGLYYNEPFNDVNVVAFLAGGITGTTVDIDAMFFYKKGE